MPERVQLRRTKGWRIPPNTARVDRCTIYGNRHVVAFDPHPDYTPQTAEQAVEFFKRDLEEKGYFISPKGFKVTVDLIRRNLRGKNLACWCKPGTPCHADVLLQIANVEGNPNSIRGLAFGHLLGQ